MFYSNPPGLCSASDGFSRNFSKSPIKLTLPLPYYCTFQILATLSEWFSGELVLYIGDISFLWQVEGVGGHFHGRTLQSIRRGIKRLGGIY